MLVIISLIILLLFIHHAIVEKWAYVHDIILEFRMPKTIYIQIEGKKKGGKKND